MATEELVLKPDFDITKAQAKINKLNREFEESKRKAEEIKDGIKNTENETEKCVARQKELNEEMKKLPQTSEKELKLTESLEKAKSKAEETTQKIQNISSALIQSSEKIESISARSKEINDLLQRGTVYGVKRENLEKELVENEKQLNSEVEKNIKLQERLTVQKNNLENSERNIANIERQISNEHAANIERHTTETNAKLVEQEQLQKKLESSLQKQNNALSRQNGKTATIKEKIALAKNEQTKFGKEIKKSNNPLEKFVNRIKGLAKRVFIFSVITKALRAMRDALSGYIKQDRKLSSSVANLKGNLSTIGATLSSALAPVLTFIVDKLTTITTIVGRTLAKLLGKDIKQMQKLANATQKTADSSEKATASFDTLQKIDTSKKDSDSSSDDISPNTSNMNLTAFDESIDKFLSKLEPLQEKVKTNFEKIAQSATRAFEKNKPLFEKAYNNFFAPVGEWAYSEFQEIIDEIGDGVSKIIDYFATDEFAETFDEIITLAEGVWALIKPILDELSEVVGAIFTLVANTIASSFQTIGGEIEVIGGIFEFFIGLIEWVVGVFTDDTEKMTEGSELMKDGIKLALNGIIKLFAGLVNSLSSGINFIWDLLISAVRGIVNGLGSVVSWAGKLLGKDDWGWKWEFEQPHIPKWNPPKLATGAVLPGGSPMLAWVNDQPKGQGYIEGSVENIAAAFEKYLGTHDFGGNRNITIEANGNWAQFIKWMNLQIKDESARASMYS